MEWLYDDGGRPEAGYSGVAGDCVVRSIAIAAQIPYQRVYDDLFLLQRERASKKRSAAAREREMRRSSPRHGVHPDVTRTYLADLGWEWVPTMGIGTGCQVHLRADELPPGRLIVRTSKHVTAVVDGVIRDTHDPSRGGTRCVYGYWRKEQ